MLQKSTTASESPSHERRSQREVEMTDPNFRIETERLVLTHLQSSVPSHCDFMVKLWNTKEFIASIGGKPTSITTTEAARKLIENRFQAEYARNGYGTYLVSLNEEEPIGTVSLTRGAPPTAYSAPDLGFAILPDYMRKGYAREAATGLLAWAESELHVYDVLGLCDPANEGSNGLFRSLGFVDRGVRTLKVFGNVQGAVWVRPGMAEDLSVYGL
ncbi:hypothetical protein SMMN14_05202 [Sphaerulina musiva]